MTSLFIGLPADNGGILPEATAEFGDDPGDILAINIDAPASLLPRAVVHPPAALIDHQNLGVLTDEPDGGRGTRSAEDDLQSLGPAQFDVPGQPVEREFSLFRLHE